MSLSKLPLECLELVLQVLQDQKARGTLASLLRVNRFICAATLPCLYSQALTLPQVPSTFTSRVLISPAQKSVIQLLLRQRPAAEISELLNLAYDVFPERQYANNHPDHNCDPVNDNQYNNSNKRSNSISPKKPSFDYISFIPNFDFESYVYSPQCRTPQLNLFVENYPPHLASYAFRTKTGDLAENFGEGAHDENLLLPLEVMTKGRYTPKMIFFRYGALSVTLRRDLTWTLCSPVLEQIQSLIVPLSDIDRYLNAIERFESLKSVTFMVDEVLDVKADHRGLQVDPNSRYSQQLEEGLLRQNHQFTSMIEFVRLHSLLFRGQLRTANCSVDYESCPFRRPMECPHEILQTMKDYLPPLDKPRSIGPDNWQQISRKIHATDLSCVEEFDLWFTSDRVQAERTLFEKDPLLLERCRALKSLSLLNPLDTGSFSWAKEERVKWDAYLRTAGAATAGVNAIAVTGQENNERTTNIRTVPSLSIPRPSRPLIALERLDFRTDREPFGDQLEDLVFAFNETLKEVQVLSSVLKYEGLFSNNYSFPLGYNWWLPKIEILTFKTQDTPIAVDPEFYALGLGEDHLTELNINDMCDEYRFQDLVPCQPFQYTMTKLNSLQLVGRAALTFHPDSLHKTPNLTSMIFALHGPPHSHEAETFIPPAKELMASFQDPDTAAAITENVNSDDPSDQATTTTATSSLLVPCRPLWTWDWYLPKLTYLYLNSEFAYLFKFRMLIGCPALESLSLECCTDQNQHKRRLTLQDFIHPNDLASVDHKRVCLGTEEVKFIQAPLVNYLQLSGQWIMDDEIIRLMYGTVFTGIKVLKEYQTSGYTSKTWLSTVRAMPGGPVKEVSCGLSGEDQVGVEVLKNLGLVPRTGPVFGGPLEDLPYYYLGYSQNGWVFEEDLKGDAASERTI